MWKRGPQDDVGCHFAETVEAPKMTPDVEGQNSSRKPADGTIGKSFSVTPNA
jgi:hypothetical protein